MKQAYENTIGPHDSRARNGAGQLLGETYASGPLSGLSVTNLYDEQGHRTNVALMSGSTKLYSVGYNYSGGRLASVSDGTNSATYSYLAHSPLVEQIAFKQNGTLRMTTTRAYDNLNRLTGISSAPTASPVVSFNYAYNSANQRTAVTNADNSRWTYGYDFLGQVTSGKKYWSDGAAASGQQFEYAFDDIGNRKTATRDSRQANYMVNSVNQYTNRTVPGYVNVLGEATNAATVTVNNTAATRHSNYFRVELSVTNSTPLWLGLTNLAVLNQGANPDLIATNTGNLLFAQTPETITYDPDGNLTSDSLWTNVWNGENRRITIESRSTVPTAGKVREQWTYLPDGRWVERIVSTNNGSSYVAMQTNRYVWDGNVLLAVLNGTNGLELAFMRGIDMSGSLQGAGGVDGLLAVQVGPAGPAGLANTMHFAAYDGNGNVAALVNAADGKESARYEHGPFAEPLRITGAMGLANPIRFSTQYADDYTGDLKYLYRDLRDGRWLSRDPISEKGGRNIYGFVGNDSANHHDRLGLIQDGEIGTRVKYYCKCGWIDSGHLGTGDHYQQIMRAMDRYESNQAANVFPLYQSQGHGFGNGVTYRLKYSGHIGGRERLELACGIFMHMEKAFESWQGTLWSFAWLISSSFSVEDLPTDYLSFMIAAQDLSHVSSVEGVCGQPLSALDAQRMWHFGSGPKQNSSFTPAKWTWTGSAEGFVATSGSSYPAVTKRKIYDAGGCPCAGENKDTPRIFSDYKCQFDESKVEVVPDETTYHPSYIY